MSEKNPVCLSVILPILLTSGCFSYQRAPLSEVRRSNQVRLTMTSGSRSKVTVRHVEYPYLISDENRRYDLRYVNSLEVERVDATATTVVVLLATAASVATLVIAAGMSFGSHDWATDHDWGFSAR